MISDQETTLRTTVALPRSAGARRTFVGTATYSMMVFAVLFFPGRDDTSGAVLGTIAGFGAAAIGFAALRRSRVLPSRSVLELARYAGFTLLLGLASGTANLLINVALTELDPRIRAMMVHKITTSSDWSMVVSAPVVEELTFRLLILSSVAWLLGRHSVSRNRIFPMALTVSAVLFSLIHIGYPIPLADPVMLLRTAVVLVKSTAVGLLLGWIFWRWGLPYSIACHGVANGIHILLAPLFF